MNTGQRRLLKLARILRDVPRRSFNMASWRSDCGTTACAIGHACADSGFKRAGLHLEKKFDMYDSTTVSYFPVLDIPGVGTFTDWEAVAAFFSLSQYNAKLLFLPNGIHRTPKQVAAKLELFVRTGEFK